MGGLEAVGLYSVPDNLHMIVLSIPPQAPLGLYQTHVKD